MMHSLEENISMNYDNHTLVIIGECGTGKSSSLNALFNINRPISHVEACTLDVEQTTIDINGFGKWIVYDMPGIGESLKTDEKYKELYRKTLPKADVIIWMISAGNRALSWMQRTLDMINKDVGEEYASNMLFVINKADIMYPNNWNNEDNCPSEEQEVNLLGFKNTVIECIVDIVPDWKGSIEIISAIKKYRIEELRQRVFD